MNHAAFVFITVLIFLGAVHSHPGFGGDVGYAWSSVFDASSFANGIKLNIDYVLFWNVNATKNFITFAAVVHTNGWVGFGLTSSGSMKGADIATLENIGGTLTITDRYANDFVMPEADVQQDKYLHTAMTSQTSDVTIFVWSQMLAGCNTSEDRAVRSSAQWVIYAYGANGTSVMGYHASNRGQALVSFINTDFNTRPALPNGTLVTTVTTPQVTIPSGTTYMCSRQNFPSDKKYHVVYIQPIINSSYVHHMILYTCTGANSFTTTPQTCGSMGTCSVFWAGWAVGGVATAFPAQAGLPMGLGSGTNITYAILQIHYNNPYGTAGIQDSSGFRLYYSSTLRTYDIGTLAIAQPLLSIPAGQAYVEAQSWCPGGCTSSYVPASGVTVTEVFFHMHQLGYSGNARHFLSNGTEIEPIATAERYDFNVQTGIPPPIGRKILPGDQIFLSCGYNSLTASKTTTWGEATTDEMCMLFITYYPLMPKLSTCATSSTAGVCLANGYSYTAGDKIVQFASPSTTPGWTRPCWSLDTATLATLYPTTSPSSSTSSGTPSSSSSNPSSSSSSSSGSPSSSSTGSVGSGTTGASGTSGQGGSSSTTGSGSSGTSASTTSEGTTVQGGTSGTPGPTTGLVENISSASTIIFSLPIIIVLFLVL